MATEKKDSKKDKKTWSLISFFGGRYGYNVAAFEEILITRDVFKRSIVVYEKTLEDYESKVDTLLKAVDSLTEVCKCQKF